MTGIRVANRIITVPGEDGYCRILIAIFVFAAEAGAAAVSSTPIANKLTIVLVIAASSLTTRSCTGGDILFERSRC